MRRVNVRNLTRKTLAAACAALLTALAPPPLEAQQELKAAAAAPPAYSPELLTELRRLQQAALKSDYAYARLSHLTNNIGPRLSGSPQAQRAVEYVADEMRRLGLEVRLGKVNVPHWVRGTETGELVEFPGQAPGTKQKLVLTALGGSVATPPEGLTAEVVVVQDWHDFEKLGREKVAGKIVLMNKKFDRRLAAQGLGGEAYQQLRDYRGGAAIATSYWGGVAALVRSAGGAAFRLPHTGAMGYDPEVAKVPAAAVSAEDADLIASLAAQGTVRVRLVLTPQTLPDAPSYNVIADLKGSEHPEQVVVVSAHLDSWDLGTGALDNASGVATAMATMHLLKELKLTPRRTVRFIAWMNEENGMAGALTYAREQAAELPNHFAAIESDLGAGHPIGLKYKADPKVAESLAPVSEVLAARGAGLMQRVESTEADIEPLAGAGVPAFGLWQDSRTYFDYHHTAADTLDKVNPEELSENVALMAVLAYALASTTRPLPR